MRKIFLLFLTIIITAISFGGFFSKYSMTDNGYIPFDTMIEVQNERRPWVYRQLLPFVTREISNSLSDERKEKLLKKFQDKLAFERTYGILHFDRIPEKYWFEAYVLSIISFLFLFAAIITLRSILCEVLNDEVSGTLTSFIFAIIFPLIETVGGYYYDLSELLFMFLGIRFALHGNFVALLIMTPIATLNKESFLFFLIMLFPFFEDKFGLNKSRLMLIPCILVSGLIYLYIKNLFENNLGTDAMFQLFSRWDLHSSHTMYFHTEITYGIPLGARMFFLHLLMLFWILKDSWINFSNTMRKHFLISFSTATILYLLFCYPGEMRNFSLAYFPFIVAIGFYIKKLLHEKIS